MLTHYFLRDAATTEWLLLEMAGAGFCVILAAIRLTRLADRLADERGLGKAFVGMLLLATVTSLPEVVAGATAGAIGAVDMAFGAVYGSCSFNIVIIVMMNLVIAGGGSVLQNARPAQLLSSSFGIVMITLSLLAIATVRKFDGHVATQQTVEIVTMIGLIVIYAFCMNLIHKFERRDLPVLEIDKAMAKSHGLNGKIVTVALLTIAAAWWLTQTGDVLAEHPIAALGRPLGKTIVGVLFLAAATSLPEIATSITAVRMHNLDMALGNVFGSNMFNILVLPVTKVAALLSGRRLMMDPAWFSTSANLLAGLLPILLTAIAVAGIAYRTQRRVFRLGFDSFVLLLVYCAGMAVIMVESSSPPR